MQKENIMDYDTVALDEEKNELVIIDQTKLPGKIEIIRLKEAKEIWDAIYLLKVRVKKEKVSLAGTGIVSAILFAILDVKGGRKNEKCY